MPHDRLAAAEVAATPVSSSAIERDDGSAGRARTASDGVHLDGCKRRFPNTARKVTPTLSRVERKRASPASTDEGADIAAIETIPRCRLVAKIRSYQAVSFGARDSVQHESQGNCNRLRL